LLVLGTACDTSGPRVVERSRVVEDPGLAWHASTAERFGLKSSAESFRASAPSTSELSWDAPADWRRGGERPMREVTFELGEPGSEAECYVTVLPGHAGGALANVNRWRSQMGATPMTDGELAALEHVTAFGADRALIEIDGPYRGMGGEEVPEARLVGIVCSLGRRTVFVKMIGPRGVVGEERAAFVDFCASLEEAE
jgi:hypothetical protein